jgi:predicted secreted Zn-dependent protease
MALQAGSTTAYPANFYSDATTKNGGGCTSSANPNLTLNQVFTQVATSFTTARLIPN